MKCGINRGSATDNCDSIQKIKYKSHQKMLEISETRIES